MNPFFAAAVLFHGLLVSVWGTVVGPAGVPEGRQRERALAVTATRKPPAYHTTQATRYWIDGEEVTEAVFAADAGAITEMGVGEGGEVLTIKAKAKAKP